MKSRVEEVTDLFRYCDDTTLWMKRSAGLAIRTGGMVMEWSGDRLVKPKILVLSDENLVALLQKHLPDLDASYLRPRDVEEALSRLKTVDIAVVAFHLQSGGLQALRSIFEIDGTLPVIVVSSSPKLPDMQACIRSGAFDYLLTPFESEDIQKSVFRAMKRRWNDHQRSEKIHALTEQLNCRAEAARHVEEGVTELCMALLRTKSASLVAHSYMVAQVGEKFARFLGWDDEKVRRFRLTAMFHDFGFVTLDEAICRRGPQSLVEQIAWQRHPLIARQLLKKIFPDEIMWDALEHHHEAWNGSGFPGKLTGTRIPTEARALAIINDFVARVQPPYSGEDRISVEDAVLAIMDESERSHDPAMVDRFTRFVSETELDLS